MTRIFVAENYAPGELIPLDAAQIHYLRDVLRLREGGRLVVVGPDGRAAEAKLEGERARIESVGPPCSGPTVQVVLYAALTKHKSFEWMIEKATEVGVTEIVPVVTERSVVRPREDRLAPQVQRWQKIAEAAGRQCQSPTVPPVHPPVSFGEALARGQGGPGIIFALPAPEQAPGLKRVLADLRGERALGLFIGPEGDFSPAEVAQAQAAGLRPASLGTRVLRAETAAVVAVALCLYEMSLRGE
jgi:16S rRNA (uracil1498-N3)-methyltransferase